MRDGQPSVQWSDKEIVEYANSANKHGLQKYIVEFWDQLLPDQPNAAEVDFGTSRFLSGATVRRFKIWSPTP